MESSEGSSVECRSVEMNNAKDPLTLQNADHLGMVLVTALLTHSNFLTWSRSIRRALAAKNKLAFVNGEVAEPEKEPDRGKWRRADEMVTSWIINSMSKEIADTFVYCTSTRKLW